MDNGNAIVAFQDTTTDPGGDIRANLVTPGGGPGTEFPIVAEGNQDAGPDIAALADGGAVAAWTPGVAAPPHSGVQRLAANGTPRRSAIFVEGSGATSEEPTVIGLANGTFVVAWQEEPAGSDQQSIWMRRYRANGTAFPEGRVLVAGPAAVNQDVQGIALPDGGFVLAYTDDSWGIDGSEITARVFNANGSPRSGFVRANGFATQRLRCSRA